MNTLQNVYNKLADKTELAKHEVELGTIDELKKLTAEAISVKAAFNKTNEILTREAKLALIQADKFTKDIDKIETLTSSIKKQYTELGLNYLDNENVKNAIALMKDIFDVERQAGYIKQIIK